MKRAASTSLRDGEGKLARTGISFLRLELKSSSFTPPFQEGWQTRGKGIRHRGQAGKEEKGEGGELAGTCVSFLAIKLLISHPAPDPKEDD